VQTARTPINSGIARHPRREMHRLFHTSVQKALSSGAVSRAGCKIVCPMQKTHQLHPFPPEKPPEFPRIDGFSFATGIGFNPPLEIFAAPWPQAMASRCVPQKADCRQHSRTSGLEYNGGVHHRPCRSDAELARDLPFRQARFAPFVVARRRKVVRFEHYDPRHAVE
jgi:hypothetical protein